MYGSAKNSRWLILPWLVATFLFILAYVAGMILSTHLFGVTLLSIAFLTIAIIEVGKVLSLMPLRSDLNTYCDYSPASPSTSGSASFPGSRSSRSRLGTLTRYRNGIASCKCLMLSLLFVRDQADKSSFRDLTPATIIQATKEFPPKIDRYYCNHKSLFNIHCIF